MKKAFSFRIYPNKNQEVIESYYLKGGSLMSKHESEDEFIQRVNHPYLKSAGMFCEEHGQLVD